MKKSWLRGFAFALGITVSAGSWAAYPDKPIRLIVPASAGGAADTLARMVGKELGDKLGQAVVVENRTGAAAIVGMTSLAKSPADGYTLGMTFSGAMSINPAFYRGLPYDTQKDFEPISMVAISPLVIVVSKTLGPKTLAELITLAKKEPGKLTYGSTGIGSTQHLSVELFKSATGTDMLHVPYKGSQAAMVDMRAGLISVISDNVITLLPMIQSGDFIPLAVETPARIHALPQVPTVAESGFPDYEASGWYGMVAPGGTDKAIVEKLSGLIRDIVKAPAFTTWLGQQGMEPQTNDPRQFRAAIDRERDKWAGVIKNANIPLQDIR